MVAPKLSLIIKHQRCVRVLLAKILSLSPGTAKPGYVSMGTGGAGDQAVRAPSKEGQFHPASNHYVPIMQAQCYQIL